MQLANADLDDIKIAGMGLFNRFSCLCSIFFSSVNNIASKFFEF